MGVRGEGGGTIQSRDRIRCLSLLLTKEDGGSVFIWRLLFINPPGASAGRGLYHILITSLSLNLVVMCKGSNRGRHTTDTAWSECRSGWYWSCHRQPALRGPGNNDLMPPAERRRTDGVLHLKGRHIISRFCWFPKSSWISADITFFCFHFFLCRLSV